MSLEDLDMEWKKYYEAQARPRLEAMAMQDIEGILKSKPEAVNRDIENGTLYALLAILDPGPGADHTEFNALLERIENVRATYRGR
jgi:hypothetical protein